MTSILGCDHFAVCMTTSCCGFNFLVAIVLVVFLPSYVSILCCDLMVMSRHGFLFFFLFLFFRLQPQFYVATNLFLPNYFSGRDIKVVSRPHFLLLSSSSGRDPIEWSRHHLWSLILNLPVFMSQHQSDVVT